MRYKPLHSKGIVFIEVVIILPLLVYVFFQHLSWIKQERLSLKKISEKRLTYDGKAVFQKTEPEVRKK